MKKTDHVEQKTLHKNTKHTLHEAKVGARVRITALQGDPGVCQRLREMGFCELSKVYKVAESGALICQTCGGKIALSRNLAKNIVVETVDKIDHKE